MEKQQERNNLILYKYVPENAVDIISEWIYKYNFKLKIKKSRSSKFGDYRPPIKGLNHQITINNDLNIFSFLITLIHEVAHLTNWEKHKERVKPHGEEWKMEFKTLIQPFLTENIFPLEVILALKKYMNNPAASSCSDLNLYRVLKKYDEKKNNHLLEELPHQSVFKDKSGKIFIKGNRIRTRYKCTEVNTKTQYLFHPLCQITLISEDYTSMAISKNH